MKTQFDDFDKKILQIIQDDAQTSQNEIANKVNLSTAAVSRRIKRMSSEGIIDKWTVCIDPNALDYALTIIVNVEVESEQPKYFNDIKKIFKSCSQIQQCYYVTGEWDFILILLVKDMDEYNLFIDNYFFSNDNVKRFKTFVVMDGVKTGAHVPIIFHSDEKSSSLEK